MTKRAIIKQEEIHRFIDTFYVFCTHLLVLFIRQIRFSAEKADRRGSYGYDLLGRMTSATTATEEGTSETAMYAYNGDGQRVAKTDNENVTTWFLYEGSQVVLEKDSAGNATRNIYGLNLISRSLGAEITKTINAEHSVQIEYQEKAYYQYNGHGDVTRLTDAEGTELASYRYDAFGQVLEQSGTGENPYRYAGYRYDEESELYYLNARYYDARIARFMSEDIYRGTSDDPLSLNRYAYCINNPIRYYDPSGRIYINKDRDENNPDTWDDRDLNDEALANVLTLTAAWNAAETDEEREAIHAEAEAIRNDPNSYTKQTYASEEYDMTTVTKVEKRDQILDDIVSAIEEGTFDGEKFSSILAENGIDMQRTETEEGYGFTGKFGKSAVTVEVGIKDEAEDGKEVSLERSIKHYYKAYVFADASGEFAEDLKEKVEEISEKTGIPIEEIGYGLIRSNDHFESTISSIQEPEGGVIEFIVIDTHAGRGNLIWSNGPNTFIEDVNDLTFNAPIKTIVLIGCNTAESHDDANIAAAFAKKGQVGSVVGSDGETETNTSAGVYISGSEKGWYIYIYQWWINN